MSILKFKVNDATATTRVEGGTMYRIEVIDGGWAVVKPFEGETTFHSLRECILRVVAAHDSVNAREGQTERRIEQAEEIWRVAILLAASQRDVKDWGSCVLGAGIETKTGRKNAEGERLWEMVISPPPSPWQGSCTWEGETVRTAIAYLMSHGIEAAYNPGMLD